jgi:hypothetical protein
MNACHHVAAYWRHRAMLYRRLHWFRQWDMARRENQKYALLAIGLIEEN